MPSENNGLNPSAVDIIAIGAHPDDIEIGCGGTLAKEAKQGKKIAIIDLTQGELGTYGTPQIRQQEAEAAQKILGATYRENLCLPDGFFEINKETLIPVIQVIRKYQPKIVLCNPPSDRHPDHDRASELVQRACFLSGLSKIETEQPPWRPNLILCYLLWNLEKPDLIIDISDEINLKIEAFKAYKSQFYNPNNSEKSTPIGSKNFLESITYRAKNFGRIKGIPYGEGYLTLNPPLLLSSLFDLKS